MRDRQAGFTLIEVLVVMAIFTIIIIAASQSFVPLLSQTKQQGKIAVSNIEGMLGLEVMRRDIAHAGYGLYWSFDTKSAPSAPAYAYAEVTAAHDANGAALSDAPSGNPRAIVIGGGRGLNGSDWVAVKAVNVAANQLSERWAYLYASPTITVTTWTPATENVGSTEYAVVVRPDQTERYLMFTTVAKAPFVQFKDVAASYDPGTTSLVFSLGTTALPKMPFNRADYVVQGNNVPARCAPGTGVLFKKVVDQAFGSPGYLSALPLLDCVADMQVAYRFDSNADGYADAVADATADQPLTAADARKVREVRVYLLAQEGAVDRSFTYPNATVTVGETGGPYGSFGRNFDLTAITNWQNYRWKLYTLVIEPICLLDWTVAP